MALLEVCRQSACYAIHSVMPPHEGLTVAVGALINMDTKHGRI